MGRYCRILILQGLINGWYLVKPGFYRNSGFLDPRKYLRHFFVGWARAKRNEHENVGFHSVPPNLQRTGFFILAKVLYKNSWFLDPSPPSSSSRAILKDTDTLSVTVLLKRPTVFASLTIALLASLSACAGSQMGKQMEQSLAPDPQLKDNKTFGQQGLGSDNSNQSPGELANETTTKPSPTATSPSSTDTGTDTEPTAEASPGQSEPTAEASPGQSEPTAEASPGQSEPTVAVSPGQSEPTAEASPEASEPDKKPQKVPEGLRPYVQDLSNLGVLKVAQKESGEISAATKSLLEPNQHVSRRDFARWLLEANNRMHPNQPGKFIHQASLMDEPAFQDVPSTDPDFPYIQGLAEVGVIPSPLSGDTNKVNFGPDEPLTRQQMILWKVHLDTRQPFPKTTVENVNEAWGFRDASKVDADALGAVMLDFSNGDNSNIRRVYGYTSLFHPKFPVTRAEAAASLWYFGFQGDGVSAEDILKANSSS